MPDDKYRFTVGDFECLVIKDSAVMGNAQHLFQNADKDDYEKALKARDENTEKIELPYNPLAVFSDDWVLLDTGIGKLGEEEGRLAEVLEGEDIRPEHIILTHAHADHYGGLLDKDDNEVFGNVPIYMCQNEWVMSISGEYADTNPRRAELAQNYLLPLEGQIERIECYHLNEILPGFSVLKLAGHTPNHMGVLIESQGEKLIVTSDAVIHPLHFEHLDWRCGFDADHDLARESRVKLAELAIELDALVLCYHFPFPGLGRISQHNGSYKWTAID
ncbi:MAG: MBL fold metallo-hydrolase [Phototrophicaceae bacterium]